MFTRNEVLGRLRKTLEEGRPIIGGGASTGISAKCQEAGGIDLIVIYNSGRFRMAGRGSAAGFMPYGDANAIVMEMAREVLPVVRDTPVLAGVCGTDPFRMMQPYLRQLKEIGFSGVQNFPTVGLCDGLFRQSLEETGMGFGLEVEMIRTAHEMDMFTSPYVFNANEARAMAKAGADMIVAHLGITTKGLAGVSTSLSLEAAADRVQEICEAARSVNVDIICLCHGGPIAEPADAEYVLRNAKDVLGFCGASSMERLPAETAIRQQAENFKMITFKDNRATTFAPQVCR